MRDRGSEGVSECVCVYACACACACAFVCVVLMCLTFVSLFLCVLCCPVDVGACWECLFFLCGFAVVCVFFLCFVSPWIIFVCLLFCFRAIQLPK